MTNFSALTKLVDDMPEADGYEKWRTAEAADLASLVQRRLTYLQNPPDCENARKIVCNLNKVSSNFFSTLMY